MTEIILRLLGLQRERLFLRDSEVAETLEYHERVNRGAWSQAESEAGPITKCLLVLNSDWFSEKFILVDVEIGRKASGREQIQTS